MPSPLDVADHLDALTRATVQLATDAERAGLGGPVPTCPGWSVRDLVEHIGGVHRWATSIVSEAPRQNVPDAEQDRLMPPPVGADLLEWFAEGADLLVAAIEKAPDDLQALVFLRNAPSPRRFWARRMAHETTIHRIDALAARHGHLVTTGQAAIDRDLAVDGIDELLTGFVTRRSSALRTVDPLVVVVAPSDADAGWTLRLSAEPVVTATGAAPGADAVVSGTSAGLYLGLWNRGDEIAVTGEPELLGVWRDKVRIAWS